MLSRSAEGKAFGLSTPQDLHDKFKHDIERLRLAESTHEARYAAFDCAVGGWHLTDWVLNAVDDDARVRLSGYKTTDAKACDGFLKLQSERLPALLYCRDIANGAKHFLQTSKSRLGNVSTSTTVVFKFGNRHIDGLGNIVSAGHKVKIKIDDVQDNALDIFSAPYSQWGEFLSEEGLNRRYSNRIIVRKNAAE